MLAKPVKQSQLLDMLVSVLSDVDSDDTELRGLSRPVPIPEITSLR